MNGDDSVERICETIEKCSPDHELIRLAARHLSRAQAGNLLEGGNFLRKNAEGYLFESLVYESIIDLASKTDLISQVIAKTVDVPRSSRTYKPRSGDEGLFYNARGEPVIRADGVDLAEFDAVFIDKFGHLVFCEIKTSPNNLKTFDRKASYNRRLLSILFGSDTKYLLVSSVDIRNMKQIKNFISESGNYFAYVNWFNDDLKRTASSTSPSNAERRNVLRKFCLWTDLKTVSKLDYENMQRMLRRAIITSIAERKPREEIIHEVIGATIVERIIIGTLDSNAINFLLSSCELKAEGRVILSGEFEQRFSRIVMSLSLPCLRPVLYLRERKKRSYVKMGPCGPSQFGFERNIVPRHTAFFSALEATGYQLHANDLEDVLGMTMVKDVFERKKKAGHHLSSK